ncbi:hypothetical protein [Alteromonas sp. C1M14]
MQYKIILPSDYPMEKIETRIRGKRKFIRWIPWISL